MRKVFSRCVAALSLCVPFALPGCGGDSGAGASVEESSSASETVSSSSQSSSSGDTASSAGSSCSSAAASSSSSSIGSSSSGHSVTWVGHSALVITEVSSVNISWLDDEGEDPGWVEIYNAGSVDADLAGYSLVENREKPRKWVFGHEKIPAKGFRTVFCSGRNLTEPPAGMDSDSAHYRTHTNWKLGKDGGSIYLLDSNWSIRDSVNYPALTAGTSWGIVDGGNWKYFGIPTPEAPNTETQAYEGYSPAVSFASGNGAGFYSDPITLEIPAATGATVRCTFDGSSPTASTPEMTSPYYIKSNTVVSCAAFKDGYLSGAISTNSYFIGESVAMPVVSISVAPDYFTKYYYDNESSCAEPCYSAGYWEDVEYPVHVEYFANGSSSASKAWEINAGISIIGHWSRYNAKKSVAIRMREEYQTGWLKYKLFETRPEDGKFKGFNLRNNGNRFHWDYVTDPAGLSALEGSDIDYQRSRQVVVFYNGKYYGIHDMREKLDENFIETNYGIDASTVESVAHLGDSVTVNGGTADGYWALINYIADNDFSGEANAAYDSLKTIMDVGEYADYMAAEIYYRNGDWPNNNVRAWRAGADHPWKFIAYDIDHGFNFEWTVAGFGTSVNMFDWILRNGKIGSLTSKSFGNFYKKLIQNPDFKRMFVNRAAVMLQYYLASDRMQNAITSMVETIPSAEMTRDLAKWPRKSYAFDKTGSSLKSFASSRPAAAWQEFVDEFSLGTDVSITIAASGSGEVKMEGMDLPGSTATSTKYSGTFFGGNAMVLTAVPAAGHSFSKWEDGSTDNPRTISPVTGVTYTATFN